MSDPRSDFSDRVMIALGDEPLPSATRSFMTAVRTRSLGDAFSAFSVAWHLGTVRRWSVTRRVRVQAIALVLSVLVALGVGSIATATGVRLAVTGVNELGNVINHQFGTDEQGDVQYNSPDANGSQPGQDDGPQTDLPGGGQEGVDGRSGPSGADEAGGTQGGDGGAEGAGGASGANGASGPESSNGGEGDSSQ